MIIRPLKKFLITNTKKKTFHVSSQQISFVVYTFRKMKFFFPERKKKSRKKKKFKSGNSHSWYYCNEAHNQNSSRIHFKFIINYRGFPTSFPPFIYHPPTPNISNFSKNDEMKLKGDGKFMQIYIATLKMFYSNESCS
ncbi:hypothetical protein ACKWTF_001464 [Chironomus riparius]